MKANTSTSFLDLLFNITLGFVMLFFLSFYMINQSKKEAQIETKAEIVITVTWPDGFKSDVDTWLEDPMGRILYFRQDKVGLMHLDRDDLGCKLDEIILPTGEIVINPHNQELTTIRGFIPGEWTLNIHMYKKRDEPNVPVEVSIDKLNPSVKRIFFKVFYLTTQWQELTVTRFTTTQAGTFLNWNTLPKKLVSAKEIDHFQFGGEDD